MQDSLDRNNRFSTERVGCQTDGARVLLLTSQSLTRWRHQGMHRLAVDRAVKRLLTDVAVARIYTAILWLMHCLPVKMSNHIVNR